MRRLAALPPAVRWSAVVLRAVLLPAVVLPAAWLLTTVPARGQATEEQSFHNTAYLPDPHAPATLRYEEAREALGEGRLEEAAAKLIQALEGSAGLYVPIGLRTDAPLYVAVARTLLQGSDALRRAYRRLAAEASGKALALAGHDARRLLEVARRWPLTPAGARALLGASDAHRMAGRPRAAARLLRDLDRWLAAGAGEHDATDGSRDAVAPPARDEVRHALATTLDLAAAIEARAARGLAERLGPPLPRRPPTARIEPVWSSALLLPIAPQHNPFEGVDTLIRMNRIPRIPKSTQEFWPSFAHLVGPLAFAQDHEALFGVRLDSGRSVFGFFPYLSFTNHLFLGDNPRTRPAKRDRRTLRLTDDGRRLYAIQRTVAERGGGSRGFLLALDLDREGFLPWARGGSLEDEGPLARTFFPAPPRPLEGRLYLPAVRGEKTRDVLAVAIEASTGRLAWSRYTGSASPVAPHKERLEATDTPLHEVTPPATDGERVVFLTDLGLVVALDPAWEDVAWIFRYHRVNPEPFGTITPETYWDVGGWEEGTIRWDGARFVVAPGDSRHLYLLAAEPDARGDLMLAEPIARERLGHPLAGIAPDRLVLTAWRGAGRTLVQLEDDGRVVWESDPLGPDDGITGQGCLAGRYAYVPTLRGIVVFEPGGDPAPRFRYEPPTPPKPPHPHQGICGNLTALPDGILGTAPVSWTRFRFVKEPGGG